MSLSRSKSLAGCLARGSLVLSLLSEVSRKKLRIEDVETEPVSRAGALVVNVIQEFSQLPRQPDRNRPVGSTHWTLKLRRSQ